MGSDAPRSDPAEPSGPSDFERAVADLLRLAGFDVKGETLLRFKRADLVASQRRLGRLHRIAVECKSSRTPVGLSELKSLAADYAELFERGEVDEVLVVTPGDLTPAAMAKSDQSRFLRHISFAALQNEVMDFTSYVRGLRDQYYEDGLDRYYVRAKTTRGADLEAIVDEWLADQSDQPLALLGTYGIGKTTFAEHYAHEQAKRFLADAGSRMPVLLRLGDISSEQSLEGLLGKAFTSQTVVRNYTFPAFMALNRAGRFLVLLDGFDEMKQALSADEFLFNMGQLNMLVTPRSRVVLLGRPTAFLSDDEQRLVLHGERRVALDHIVRQPDWPDYREVEVATFEPAQASQFLDLYLAYRKATVSQDVRGRIERFERSRLRRFEQEQIADLARRPVQLRMLAELLPEAEQLPGWDGDARRLTVSLLYSIFIDYIIQRDQRKIARRLFDAAARRRFAKELAVLLWKSRAPMTITPHQIPAELLKPFVDQSHQSDVEAVRRDLVAACFLERRAGDVLGFPHRSFQEFLVAEFVVEGLIDGTLPLIAADALTTREVAEFLGGLVSDGTMRQIGHRLREFKGSLSWRFCEALLADRVTQDRITQALGPPFNPWFVLLSTARIVKVVREPARAVELLRKLLSLIPYSRGADAVLCFFAILVLSKLLSARQGLSYVAQAIDQIRLLGATTDGKWFPDLEVGLLICEFGIHGTGRVHLRPSYRVMARQLREHCMLSDWLSNDYFSVSQLELPDGVILSNEAFRSLIAYREAYCSSAQKVVGSPAASRPGTVQT